MGGAYFNGKFVKEVRCWKCGSHFYSNRSDAMFCSKCCRLSYYKNTRPKMRDIKCSDCGNRSDKMENANYGKISKGKRTLEIAKFYDWRDFDISMISKLLDNLRKYSAEYDLSPFGREIEGTKELLNQAADTIEALSEKLAAVDMERNEILKGIRQKAQELSNQHWGDDERHLIGKGIQCMCVQAENIINENMVRQADDCVVWISADEPPKDSKEVLIFNGKSYSVGYYDGKEWVNSIHPVKWKPIEP